MSLTPTERFWAKVEPTGFCWNWTGALGGGGYGVFTLKKPRMQAAHRFAYEALIGPIPDGLYLDHLCRNRACVNPDHLEPVTQLENLRRGYGTSVQKFGARDHCSAGHRYTEANTRMEYGRRICRACHAIRHRRKAS